MKKYYLIAALSFLFMSGYSQKLSQVTFSSSGGFSWFSILTNQNILIRISDDGKILEFGTEEQSLHNRNYYDQKLRPYVGTVNYYGKESDSASMGKIKNIGSCFFTYYPAKDYAEKAGKIKSAGSLLFDYNMNSGDALTTGKIKTMGSNAITYFTSFDNEALKGKLRSIGPTQITYYTSFDDTMIKGKLKSIGSFQYIWYTSYDRKEYSGSLKSGSRRQLVNGVTYIMQ